MSTQLRGFYEKYQVLSYYVRRNISALEERLPLWIRPGNKDGGFQWQAGRWVGMTGDGGGGTWGVWHMHLVYVARLDVGVVSGEQGGAGREKMKTHNKREEGESNNGLPAEDDLQLATILCFLLVVPCSLLLIQYCPTAIANAPATGATGER
ncbi:hypothetical protein EYF80_018666 [Liparis tanakae]|uniref:Uncharacterized protein n=1 Tax=Liparis tanakae TaxID=230148 RepID=A0A4Z2HZC7_9TELE|nr:hypothetical protein EYF80_018666 [Liparis tanakae]